MAECKSILDVAFLKENVFSFLFFIVDSLPFLEFASFGCFHQLQMPFLNVDCTVFRHSDRRQLVLKPNTIAPAANNLQPTTSATISPRTFFSSPLSPTHPFLESTIVRLLSVNVVESATRHQCAP